MSTSQNTQPQNKRAIKAAMAMAAAVATGTLIVGCGGSQDSAQVSQSTTTTQSDNRQAGGNDNATLKNRQQLEADKAKAQRELNEVRRKIAPIQYRWDLNRGADPSFRPTVKEKLEMFTLRATEQDLIFKIRGLDRQLENLNAQ